MDNQPQRTRWRIPGGGLFALALALALPAAAAGTGTENGAAADPLVVGIFPRRSPAVTRRMFRPLLDRVAEGLGRPVRLDTPPDFTSFWDRVQKGRYALVHYNPYHYLRAHRDLGHRVIARNEEFGRSAIRAAIVVHRDSGITAIRQLRGRKVLFGGGPDAMVSYIAATALLRRAGLAAGDYLEGFALSPPKACIAVYYRQAAACGAGDGILRLRVFRQAVDPDALTILVSGPPLAHLPWAVTAQVDEVTRRRVRALLTGLGQTRAGREALEQAGLTGLVAATDADYDPHRELVAAILGERY